MNTWWRGIQWDWRLLIRARTAPVIVLTVLVLGGLAGWNGWHIATQWQSEVGAARAQAERQREELAGKVNAGESSATPYAAKGIIVLPVGPLADFASGRSDLDPRIAEATTFGQAHLLFRDYQIGNPMALAQGRFDLAFFAQVVLPLLIIVLGYGVGSGRYDTIGRMLTVQGASVRRTLFTRIVARALIIGLPMILVVAATAAANWEIAEASGQRETRLLVALALMGGYVAFWWGLVAWVASFRWRESRALTVLLSFWIFLVLVVPAVVGSMARQVHAAPSRFALIAQARAAEIAAPRYAESLLGEYTHDHPELQRGGQDLPAWAKSVFVVARSVDQAIAPILHDFDEALRQQQRAVSRWQYASPALVLQQGRVTTAGTDERRHLDFRRSALRYFESFREYTGRLMLSGQPLTIEQLRTLPAFHHPERSIADITRDMALPLIVLWALALGLLGSAFLRAGREEPDA